MIPRATSCSRRARRGALPDRVRLRAGLGHLKNHPFPSIKLETNDEKQVALEELFGTSLVLYLFAGTRRSPFDGPRSRHADALQQQGFCQYAWEIRKLGYRTVGASTQQPHELVHNERKGEINHDLLSDRCLRLAATLALSTFTADRTTGFHRVALLIHGGVIQRAVLADTPGSHATQVFRCLQQT
jgi:peroxiredoxin